MSRYCSVARRDGLLRGLGKPVAQSSQVPSSRFQTVSKPSNPPAANNPAHQANQVDYQTRYIPPTPVSIPDNKLGFRFIGIQNGAETWIDANGKLYSRQIVLPSKTQLQETFEASQSGRAIPRVNTGQSTGKSASNAVSGIVANQSARPAASVRAAVAGPQTSTITPRVNHTQAVGRSTSTGVLGLQAVQRAQPSAISSTGVPLDTSVCDFDGISNINGGSGTSVAISRANIGPRPGASSSNATPRLQPNHAAQARTGQAANSSIYYNKSVQPAMTMQMQSAERPNQHMQLDTKNVAQNSQDVDMDMSNAPSFNPSFYVNQIQNGLAQPSSPLSSGSVQGSTGEGSTKPVQTEGSVGTAQINPSQRTQNQAQARSTNQNVGEGPVDTPAIADAAVAGPSSGFTSLTQDTGDNGLPPLPRRGHKIPVTKPAQTRNQAALLKRKAAEVETQDGESSTPRPPPAKKRRGGKAGPK